MVVSGATMAEPSTPPLLPTLSSEDRLFVGVAHGGRYCESATVGFLLGSFFVDLFCSSLSVTVPLYLILISVLFLSVLPVAKSKEFSMGVDLRYGFPFSDLSRQLHLLAWLSWFGFTGGFVQASSLPSVHRCSVISWFVFFFFLLIL